MTCPCCLPKCCPAYRAFDGSNTFYRYLTKYDWDIPTIGFGHTLTPADQDFAVIDANLTPAPPGRLVDGHEVLDSAAACQGYPTEVDNGDLVFRQPGLYGNFIAGLVGGRLPVKVLFGGGEPSPHRPLRHPNIFNIGLGYYNDGSGLDRYIPASGDPGFYEYQNTGIPFMQKQVLRSLIRLELSGKYPSPPSPHCYLNPTPNPLP